MIAYSIQIIYNRNNEIGIAKAFISCDDFLSDEKLDRIVIDNYKFIREIYNNSKIEILETSIKLEEQEQ